MCVCGVIVSKLEKVPDCHHPSSRCITEQNRNSAECSVFVPGAHQSWVFTAAWFDECLVFAVCALSAIYTARAGQLCHCLLATLASPCLLVMWAGVGIPPDFSILSV